MRRAKGSPPRAQALHCGLMASRKEEKEVDYGCVRYLMDTEQGPTLRYSTSRVSGPAPEQQSSNLVLHLSVQGSIRPQHAQANTTSLSSTHARRYIKKVSGPVVVAEKMAGAPACASSAMDGTELQLVFSSDCPRSAPNIAQALPCMS